MGCAINLFNSKENRVALSVEFSAPDRDSMSSTIKRRLENFMLLLSAEDNYSLHGSSGFGREHYSITLAEKNGKKEKDIFPAGTVFDGRDLLVSERGCISRYDPDGKVIQKIEACGTGAGRFRASGCVQVDERGRIYVMDESARKILAFSRDGAFISEFFFSADSPASFIVTPGGHIHIPDFSKKRVQVYTREGGHIRDVLFERDRPLALCSSEGRPVVITDRKGFYRINFLSSDGYFTGAKQTGISGEVLPMDFCDMDDKGNLYGVSVPGKLVFCLDRSGRISWIKKWQAGERRPCACSPFSVSVDGGGNRLAVLDMKNRRILDFRRGMVNGKSTGTASR